MAVETITQRADNFTDRDFDSWILELRSRATAAFPGWTDFNIPNFGNMLLELFAHTLDVLSFTQDQQFRETRITFARLRRSMILLGRLIGFTLPGAVPGTTDLEITIADNAPRADSITIPKGTVVRTLDVDDPVEFDLSADAIIPAGVLQIPNASAKNARERQDEFITDGSPGQEFPLSQTPYVDNSALVTVGVDTFEEQDSFFNSGPTDKHFVVDVDEDDRGTIRFGDGINGEPPTGTAVVIYETGGGARGNVDANTLVEFRDGNRFPSAIGEEVQLQVRNPISVGDGVDRMSVEEARVAIPASAATLGKRSVTREDFENNAKKVRGVARSMLLTSDDDGSIPENTGLLFIMPIGGGLPSTSLKAAVKTLIDDDFPPCVTFTFSMEDPDLKIISIGASVSLALGITEPEARAATEAAYEVFFALRNADGSENSQIDFGFKIRNNTLPPGTQFGEIPFSDLFNVMLDAVNPQGEKVYRKVDEDLFTPADDVIILDREFPVLGSISLTNSDTTSPF